MGCTKQLCIWGRNNELGKTDDFPLAGGREWRKNIHCLLLPNTITPVLTGLMSSFVKRGIAWFENFVLQSCSDTKLYYKSGILSVFMLEYGP